MNIHNELYALYLNRKIGKVDLYNAFNKGFIDSQSLDVILALQPDYSLEEAKKFKKAEYSYICEQNILSGIDVVLSDGNPYHFSLSEKDQINLSTKMLNIAMGVTNIEYHSDGEPCKYYSVEDMTLICSTAQTKVTLETTYYNCLTQWIEGCKTPKEVMSISYGDDIPEEYQSEPWKDMVERMNGSQEYVTSMGNDETTDSSNDAVEEEPIDEVVGKNIVGETVSQESSSDDENNNEISE